MIADKNGGTVPESIFSTETAFFLHASSYSKCYASEEPHAPLKGPRNRPLDQSTIAHYAQRDSHECAIQGTAAHEEERGYGEGIVR
jgi:hypothetical protein